ncbi:bacterial surface protein [Paenibacillus sp. 481]|nr:bacterial surface protein [Paenibacillus sp. 481]
MIGILPFNGVAHANETITGIEFESSLSPVHVIVDGQSVQLKLMAKIKDKTERKDVTSLATWTSSNPSAVKVDSGWVSGVSKGTSEITVKYQGFTLKKLVQSDYMFEKLSITSVDNGQAVPSEVNAALGTKLKWKVTAADKASGTNNDVTQEAVWTTSKSEVASVDKGEIKLLAKGETEITVKHKGLSSKVKLIVALPYEEFTLSPDKLLEFEYGGAEQQVKATAKKKDGAIDDVTANVEWASSDANVVEVKNGAVKPISVGTATITATHLGRSKTITAVVRPSYHAMRLTPDKKQHAILGDAPMQLRTFVLSDRNNQNEVTNDSEWESSNMMAATVDRGIVTFKGAGTTTISAKYKGLVRTIEITVYPIIDKLKWAEVKDEAILSGSKPYKLNLIMDEAQVAVPKVNGIALNGEAMDVTPVVKWTASNTSVLAVEDGKLKPLASGFSYLDANVNGQSLRIEVNVQRKALILQTNVTNLELVAGREQAVPQVTVVYTDGTEEEVTSKMEWEASSANLFVRDGKLKGLVPSRVTLNGKFANVSMKLSVIIEEPVVSFKVEPQSITTTIKKSQTLKVTGTYRNGKTISLGSRIKWKVENDKIATVRGASVRGEAIGSTKLVGEYQGKKLEIPVQVKAKLLKLETTPSSVKLAVGQGASWKVTAIYDTGEVVDVTSQVTYVPSNTKIRAGRGTVTAVAKGSGSLKVSFEGKSATLRVSVK